MKPPVKRGEGETIASRDARQKDASVVILLRIKGVRKQQAGVLPGRWVMEGESV